MSPRRTRRGTIRESDVSANNTLRSASKQNRSTRRTNKSHLGKSSEEDDSILESHSVANITTASFLDSSTTNVKTRKRKGPEISIPDSSLSVTIDESKTKSQTKRKNANSKRETKNIKVQKLDSSLISEDESFNEKKKKDEKRVSYSIDHLISEDEEVSTITSKKRGQSRKKDSSPNKKVCKTPEISSPQKTNVVPLDGRVTPKSSPLKDFRLTPHRSTKTPKKSPENLGSPKTHSRDSLQLLNVSRKLSIAISPVSSDRSSITLQNSGSPKINKSATQTSRSSKSILKPSPSKNKSISPSTGKPRLSKSPRVVLKMTKSKSKISNKKSSPKRVSISIPRVSKKDSSKTFEDTLTVDSPSKSRSFETKRVSDLESRSNVTLPSPVKSVSKVNSPSKTRNVSESVSPKKSKKSEPSPKKIPSAINVTVSNTSIKASSPSKSRKSDVNVSLVDLKKSPKIVLADLSKISLVKSPELTPLPKSKASPKVPSTSKARTSLGKSLKATPSAELRVTPSSHSKVSKQVKQVLSSSKSKKSPKLISPLSASKMPKIVLNLKSKRLPSRFFRTSTPSKGKKSPLKSPKTPKPSQARKSTVTSSKTPTHLKATESPVKSPNAPTPLKTKKSPKSVSAEKRLSKSPKKNVSMNPRIVVKKLASPKRKSSPLAAKKIQPIVNLVPVDHTASGGKTPKSLSNLSSKNLTPLDILEKKRLKTSTPREKVMKRLLDSSSHRKGLFDKKDSALTRSPSNKSKIIKKLDDQSKLVADQPLLEDESEPSLNESSLIHMSDVFDSDTSQKDHTLETKKSESSPSKKKVNKSQNATLNESFETKKNSSKSPTKDKTVRNSTYELENPKTPGLKMKSNKRTLNDAELTINEEHESKKNCKVTFASPSRNQARSSSINRIGTPGHAILRKNTPMSTNKTKTPNSRVSVSRINHRRSLSTSNIKTPVNALVNRRRSNSLSDTASKSRKSDYATQLASINRLSRPRAITNSEKKSALKGTSAKKIPNFAEIHQKNFSKLESIVDAKKRVEKRHVKLNTGTPSAKKVNPSNLRGDVGKIAPPNASNGYNRFGFKMRKNDAVDIVSKKQVGNIESREKKRADARTVLKGVRMNKRFELQMKARLKTS